MESGIYLIKCRATRKVYIGQSKNIKKRFKHHLYQLKSGRHGNVHLKRCYNKYGKDNLSFKIIETCEVSNLNEREIFYINFYDSTNAKKGFNILKDPVYSKALLSHFSIPKVKKNHSMMMRNRWKNPDIRNKYLISMEYRKDLEYRKMMSEKTKSVWSDPEYKKKVVKKVKESKAKKLAELMSDPDYQKKMEEKKKKQHERKMEMQRIRFSNPEYAEMMRQKRRAREKK